MTTPNSKYRKTAPNFSASRSSQFSNNSDLEQSINQSPSSLNESISFNSSPRIVLNEKENNKLDSFFTEIVVTDSSGSEKKVIECLLCKKQNKVKHYQTTSSKTNLHYHLEVDHDIKDSRKPAKPRNQCNNQSFDPEKIDEYLLILIVFCFLPFSIVESEYFANFVHSLNSNYKIPTRKKLRSLLHDKYEKRKQDLIRKLASIDFISITTDSWTSCQNYNYLSLTCHFLENFEFRSFALSFKNLLGGHTADNLKENILGFLEEFSLKNKIFSIVTDNAANIRKTVQDINLNHEPVRCTGHVLQLIVKKFIQTCENFYKDNEHEAIDTEPMKSYHKVGNILSKCRAIVCSFNHSCQLKELLENQQSNEEECLNLIQDVKTRWHSTLSMIQRVHKLHSFIETIFHRQEYKNLKANLLKSNELSDLELLIQVLTPFERVSETLSGETYVTSAMIIPALKYLEKS